MKFSKYLLVGVVVVGSYKVSTNVSTKILVKFSKYLLVGVVGGSFKVSTNV